MTRTYEVKLQGWVTDTVFVTAADKAEALEEATKEFTAMKGATGVISIEIKENEND